MLSTAIKKTAPRQREISQARSKQPAEKANPRSLRLLTIAHAHPQFSPGGSEILAHHLHRRMTELPGITTHFLAAAGPQEYPDPGSEKALAALEGQPREWLLWCGGFDYFLQSLPQRQALHRHFTALLTEVKPDIIHFHHSLRLGVEAVAIARNTCPEAKILYTLHDFLPLCHRDGQMLTTGGALCEQATPARCHQCFPSISPAQFSLRDHWIRSHLDRVDKWIAPSEFLARRFREHGYPADKITVIKNGVESAPKMEENDPSLAYRFGFFGQITPYKGLETLLAAAQLLQEQKIKNISFHIHGSLAHQPRNFQKSIEAALATAGPNVTFHGPYDHAQVDTLMRRVGWVVMPSIWWENAPLVIQEAWAAGRPVISSGIGGMAEMISDGVNGLHARPGDLHHWAEVIRRAAVPARHAELSRNIVAPRGIDACARDHAALYRTLLSSQ